MSLALKRVLFVGVPKHRGSLSRTPIATDSNNSSANEKLSVAGSFSTSG